MGIADQISDALIYAGVPEKTAHEQFWALDRNGLVCQDSPDITPAQKRYARDRSETADWKVADPTNITLEDVVNHTTPTVLIGCSASSGAFTESIVKTMASKCERPIILPLSNPTEKAEAHPRDLLAWTEGKAMVATGSPFEPVSYNGHTITIPQCNNALVFPGIGLGVTASHANTFTDDMLMTVCDTLSEMAPIQNNPDGELLPNLDHARVVAKAIAKAVGKVVIEGNHSDMPCEDVPKKVEDTFWCPRYYRYQPKPKSKS